MTDFSPSERNPVRRLPARASYEEEKWAALEAISEHVLPGRWTDARQPNELEMNATSVVLVGIEEVTAKVRSGLPGDDEEDYALPIWADVLPTSVVPGSPIPAWWRGLGCRSASK